MRPQCEFLVDQHFVRIVHFLSHERTEIERAAFQEARIALLAGKPGAKQQLEQVGKEYAKEPVAMEANMRLELASLPPARTASPPQPPPAAPKKGANKGKK